MSISFFFFNDTATTEIYTLSLHDALPILGPLIGCHDRADPAPVVFHQGMDVVDDHRPQCPGNARADRSEEHTSELQSRQYLVCRLLLEKKKKNKYHNRTTLVIYISSS